MVRRRTPPLGRAFVLAEHGTRDLDRISVNRGFLFFVQPETEVWS
jgi:hypothetical protein